MKLDANAAVIEPRRGKRDPALPSLGILIFTPQDLKLFLASFPLVPERSSRIYLTDIYTAHFLDTPLVLVGPLLGAPQAVLALEKLIALGVQQVVAVGWCGSLQPHVAIGDVVLPAAARSEEGTSGHYPISFDRPGPDPRLLSRFRETLCDAGLTVHEGDVWSTDAPFRETVGKVLRYQKENVLGVEMEVAALYTVAHYRQIRLAAVLVVSDELASLHWVHGFKRSEFIHAREKLPALILKAVCSGG
jgi:uridine phosphorylase